MYIIVYFSKKHSIIGKMRLSYPNIYDIIANAPSLWNHVRVMKLEQDEHTQDCPHHDLKFTITNEETNISISPQQELPICMR